MYFSILHMSRSLSACYITRYPCLQEFNTLQGLHDDIHVIIWLILSSSELRSAYVHMMCTSTCFEYIDGSQDVYTQDNTRTYIISGDIGMYYALSKHSYVPVTSRLQVSSSNFRYLLEPRDVAVISIDDGQWSYNWYPRIVISQHR